MGIKSFETPKISPKDLIDKPLLKVSDYMKTKIHTFYPEQSLNEVMETLLTYNISGGPVVNEKHELLGMISEGDCLKHISESRYYNMPVASKRVGDYMTDHVKTIDGELSIFDAINLFLNEKKRRFPIVKDGKLVGQISQKDLLKAVLNIKSEFYQ